nr:WYL domain-containing protein [Polynucleobacter brandtiae]
MTEAINNKQLIELAYAQEVRLVKPHVLGCKNTKLELLAWQLKNSSEVALTNDWRTFELQKITNIVVKTQTFLGMRATKSNAHPGWTQIIAKIS